MSNLSIKWNILLDINTPTDNISYNITDYKANYRGLHNYFHKFTNIHDFRYQIVKT